jgi:hypothetical protein
MLLSSLYIHVGTMKIKEPPQKNIRNFRVDDETWRSFIAACQSSNSNASAELIQFIKLFNAGFRLQENEASSSIETRLEELLQPLTHRVEVLEKSSC